MGLHYHHCYSCYDHWLCELACTIEPDLYDSYWNREFGAHCLCPECDRLLNIDWSAYSGTTRSPNHSRWIAITLAELDRKTVATGTTRS